MAKNGEKFGKVGESGGKWRKVVEKWREVIQSGEKWGQASYQILHETHIVNHIWSFSLPHYI